MRFMYFFDDKIKPHVMRGKKYCNPSETGIYPGGISCIRQHDVNLYFYTKEATTIAIDSGHLNFGGMEQQFQKINIDPNDIKHVFLTHADVDHCGGVDVSGRSIFPNGKLYIGREEKQYLRRDIYRMKRLGVKIYNCVNLGDKYEPVDDRDSFQINKISVEAVHIPGHTVGHMCYIVDGSVIFTGDCLAVNESGGYSFFDFFTQFPEKNKESLQKLQEIVKAYNIQYVCTGHSGIRKYDDSIFAHITESAYFSKKCPFDPNAPYDAFRP